VYYTVSVRNKHVLIVPLQGSVSSAMDLKASEVCEVEKAYFEYMYTPLVLNVNCPHIS